MRVYSGKVIEIGWEEGLERMAWVECPDAAIPAPGRYLMAWSPETPDAPLAAPLFPTRYAAGCFQAAPPLPAGWEPGTPLMLRGPLGHGFSPPGGLRRLALAGLDAGIACLLPLLSQFLERGASVAVFSDTPPHRLPAAVEINPLSALVEAMAWADYLALDAPEHLLDGLRTSLGYRHVPAALPCPAQVLVRMPMPCSGTAACGACAVDTRRGWKLACEDGPVFDLGELLV